MLDNNQARKNVRILCAENRISYKSFAEMLGISASGMYSWIAGNFNLKDSNLINLENLIVKLKGE